MEEALRIDEQTGTNFWRKAIKQEMKNVLPAFKFIDNNVVPKFYKHIDSAKVADEMIKGLRYELRMMGVQVDVLQMCFVTMNRLSRTQPGPNWR